MILFKIFRSRRQRGITLVELTLTILLISILTMASISMIEDSLDEERFNITVQSMQSIRNALVGDPELKEGGVRTDFGYLGDMGAVPTVTQGLGALITNPGTSTWKIHNPSLIAVGWNGPYLKRDIGPANILQDAWGQNFRYTLDATGDIQITSYGADRTSGGTGLNQDINMTIAKSLIKTTIHLFIVDGSNPYIGTATVALYTPNGNGTIARSLTNIGAASKGYLALNNVPLGIRSIIVYIPNRTTPTKTIGPVRFTVDRNNYIVPVNSFNIKN